MAAQLRALAALPEDLGLIPNTHMAAHNYYNSSFRGCAAFFWPPLEPAYTCEYTYSDMNTHT